MIAKNIKKYSIFLLVVFLANANADEGENVESLSDIPDSAVTSDLPADYRRAPEKNSKKDIQKYALDSPGKTASNFGKPPFDDNMIFATFRGDRLEYQNYKDQQNFLWDVTSWVGDDYNKIYFESEGEHLLEGNTEVAETRLLYSRNIASFWDVQLGGQYDIVTPDRFFGVIGLQGFAPLWFEIDAQLYISEEADISADLEIEYDIILTQRLYLQARGEMKASVQDVEEYEVASGLNKFETGLRLRYILSRKFAPYTGISWVRKVGKTAKIANRNGEEESNLFWVTGVKLWF